MVAGRAPSPESRLDVWRVASLIENLSVRQLPRSQPALRHHVFEYRAYVVRRVLESGARYPARQNPVRRIRRERVLPDIAKDGFAEPGSSSFIDIGHGQVLIDMQSGAL